MPRKAEMITCAFCGEMKSPDEYADRANGKALCCLECESKRFRNIEVESGTHVALYACCAAFDVPFLPLIVKKDGEKIYEAEDKWLYYLNLLSDKGYYEKDGRILTFFDGGTNMLKLFGRQFDDRTNAHYVDLEMQRLGSIVGKPEQRAKWGTADLMNKTPMTQEIYDALDGMYETRAAEYKGTTLSAQQQDVLIKVCKWNYMIDLLLQKGQYPYAEKLQKMVQSELAAECMRKQDEKAAEIMRIDATVDALEKAGLMANGEFLTYDETMEAFREWCGRKKYDYSEDVCNQMILSIQNAMRANADMAMLSDLEENDFVVDTFGECEPEETPEEKAAKQYIGMTPLQNPKKRKDGNA